METTSKVEVRLIGLDYVVSILRRLFVNLLALLHHDGFEVEVGPKQLAICRLRRPPDGCVDISSNQVMRDIGVTILHRDGDHLPASPANSDSP